MIEFDIAASIALIAGPKMRNLRPADPTISCILHFDLVIPVRTRPLKTGSDRRKSKHDRSRTPG
jgi:hypothetical protein